MVVLIYLYNMSICSIWRYVSEVQMTSSSGGMAGGLGMTSSTSEAFQTTLTNSSSQ